jgi:ABC-type branched-subunit amino acid transport system substrate-binding protein
MKRVVVLFIVFFLTGCARGARVRQVIIPVAAVSPEELTDIFEKAEASFDDKVYATAAALYRKYLAQNPSNSHLARACYRLGLANFYLKDYGRAIQPFRVVIFDKEASGEYPDTGKWLGLAYYRLSDYVNAIKTLENFWEDNRGGHSREISIALADSAFRLQDYTRAKKWYRQLADRYVRKEERGHVFYRMGEADFKLGQFESARQNLEKVTGDKISRREQAQARFYLGQIAGKTGRIKEALEYDIEALELLVEEDSALVLDIEKAILQIIEDVPVSELLSLQQNYSNKFPAGLILLRLAVVAEKAGNIPIAKAYLYRFLSDFPQHPRREEAQNLLAKIYLRADIGRLGVILPLSGEYSVYGDRVLQGVMMAVEWENRSRENKISLYIRDSAGDPDTAAEAVRELVEDEHVMAIIGPVLSQTTLKAAPVAQLLSCPLITPSAGVEKIPQIGSYIFRNILTPIHQAHTLAEFAINQMCINEFAVLYPNNRYGKELKDIFSQKILDLGGKILFSDSYGVDDTDFKEQVLGISEQEPQAIFIPDFYDKVAMIAPQLVFYAREEMVEGEDDFDILGEQEELSLLGDEPIRLPSRYTQYDTDPGEENGEIDEEAIEPPMRPFSWDPNTSLFPGGERIQAPARPPIQLLGTNGWYSDKLIQIGGKYVEEAVFTSGFFLDSPSPDIRQFVKDFNERFGDKPNLLASQAFDATRMVLATIKRGAKTHEEIRNDLAGLRDFSGVTGKTGMDELGESTKEIYLLGVKKRKLVQLSGKESWLCRGGEEINLGFDEEFQKKMVIEEIDYEGGLDGRPDSKIKDTLPQRDKTSEESQAQPSQTAVPNSFPPLSEKIPIPQDDLFELEDNF